MGKGLDLVEQVFVKASTDGAVLLDPTIDIFAPVADPDHSPLFAEYRKYMYEEDHVMSPDGKEEHLIFKLAREELLNPVDPTNAADGVRLKTIECAPPCHS